MPTLQSRSESRTPLAWLVRLAFLLLVLVLARPVQAAAPMSEPRHALVVGNSSYATAPLLNATNDAQAVAKVLEKAGFTVDLKLNASQKQLQDAVTTFGDRLKGGGAGLFYFAGHGVQIKGRNFLMQIGRAHV